MYHENDVAESFDIPFSGLSLGPDIFIIYPRAILAKLAAGMLFRAGKCDPLDTQEGIYLRISHPQKYYLPLPFQITLGLCLGRGKYSVPTLKSLLNVSG